MAESIEWKVPVTVSDLPPAGAEYELIPTEAIRESLARRAGVLALVKLTARLRVIPSGRGAAVEGMLHATVRQNCVVTLEAFENEIEEPISLRFEPASTAVMRAPPVEEIVGEDPPEPLVDGKLDLAEVVSEFLTLSIDPYPRRPGAVFSLPGNPDPGNETPSPFAALAKLKSGPNGKKQ